MPPCGYLCDQLALPMPHLPPFTTPAAAGWGARNIWEKDGSVPSAENLQSLGKVGQQLNRGSAVSQDAAEAKQMHISQTGASVSWRGYHLSWILKEGHDWPVKSMREDIPGKQARKHVGCFGKLRKLGMTGTLVNAEGCGRCEKKRKRVPGHEETHTSSWRI